MADINKYLGQVAMPQLVTEIKNLNEKTLQSSKDYADGLAKNYDPAGTGVTAEANAKAYTDELANGQVKTNKEAIEKLNGDATTEGSVAKAVKDAQDTLQENIDTVSDVANQNKSDIEAINNAETGILKQAKDYTDTEAAKVQANVDALDEKVGDLPEGTTATSVVEYVNLKTAGIATDAALEELNNQLSAAQGDIATIKGDYLKAADKTELSDAIATEKERAEGVESGLDERIKAVEDDYLKAADKTELQGNIDTVSGKVTTLIGDDANKSVRTIANEELAKQLIAEGAAESLDTLAEIAAWIQEHPEDASAMNKAIEDLEALVGTLPEGVTATTIVRYIQEVVAAEQSRAEAKEKELFDAIALKAAQTDLEAETKARTEADTAMDERLTAVEAQLGDGENSVSDLIATAKQEAIDTAAGDATEKANKALEDAKAYADAEDAKIETRVEALEGTSHTHANQAELDLIASGDKAKWDTATEKAHEHANKTELDKVAEGDVAKWNAAEQNAKTYADGLNTAMDTRVKAVEEKSAANESALTDKADADDLTALAERVTTAEAGIADNKSRLDAMVEYTAAEITAMFA